MTDAPAPDDLQAHPLVPYLVDEMRDLRGEVRSVHTEIRGVEGSLRAEIRDAVNRLLAFMGLLFAALAILPTIFQFALR